MERFLAISLHGGGSVVLRASAQEEAIPFDGLTAWSG